MSHNKNIKFDHYLNIDLDVPNIRDVSARVQCQYDIVPETYKLNSQSIHFTWVIKTHFCGQDVGIYSLYHNIMLR